MHGQQRLVLRPGDSVRLWAAGGLLLVAAGLYLVVDTGADPVAVVTLAVFVAVAAYFVVQAVVPSSVEVVLDHHGLHARAFGRTVDVAWERVHLARVRRAAGDPYLHLEVQRGTALEDVMVLLPVGCDLDLLHAFLGRRLGQSVPG